MGGEGLAGFRKEYEGQFVFVVSDRGGLPLKSADFPLQAVHLLNGSLQFLCGLYCRTKRAVEVSPQRRFQLKFVSEQNGVMRKEIYALFAEDQQPEVLKAINALFVAIAADCF